MTIRKVVYAIDYIHILTFKEHYKNIISPYFSYEPLEYGIDNENTNNEAIRLNYRTEGVSINVKKDGMIFLYEGNVEDIKRKHAQADIFFEIYSKVTAMPGFIKTKRQKIFVDAVRIIPPEEFEDEIEKNKQFYNPFKNLEEFALTYNFEIDDKRYRFQFGNFSEKDIAQYQLSPFSIPFNNDLKGGLGIMCQVAVEQFIGEASFTKMKTLIRDAESIISQYTPSSNE